jgi:hypothetical protein
MRWQDGLLLGGLGVEHQENPRPYPEKQMSPRLLRKEFQAQ